MSGLGEEFPDGRVVGKNVDATGPEGREAVQALGFRAHGLAIRDGQGNVLWKQADHDVNINDVRAALRKLRAPE